MIARSSTVTCPAICTPFAMMTSLPMTQSCAICTYVMRKQRAPTVVLPVAVLPRLIVQYSRMIVPLPISTHVSSPLYFRSCNIGAHAVPDFHALGHAGVALEHGTIIGNDP